MSLLALSKDHLSDISMLVGATIGLLTTVDWLLSERQKEQLRAYGERLWIWLDDQRYGNFTRALRNRRAQKLLTAATYSAVLILQAFLVMRYPQYAPKHANRHTLLVGTLVATPAGIAITWFLSRKIHPRVIDWIVGSGGVFGFFARTAFAYTLGLIAYVLTIILVLITRKVTAIDVPTIPHLVLGIVGLLVLLVIVGVGLPIAAETVMLGVMFVWSLLWFLAVLLLLAFLRTTQFVVLRVVEYPKGPVLGLSGLLIGVAAILKSLL